MSTRDITLQGPKPTEFTVNENFHIFLDATSSDGRFRAKLVFPDNLKNTDSSKYKHCPEFTEKEKVIGLGPLIGDDGFAFYIFLGGRQVVPIEADCEVGNLVITEVQDGAAGKTGERGEAGEIGFLGSGAKGGDGEGGEKGPGGNPGPPGPAGDKGGPGEGGKGGAKGNPGGGGPKGTKGNLGEEGDPGETIDWNSTQESIFIGNEKFGPRLIGVCRNGTYEYVYVFASDPQP